MKREFAILMLFIFTGINQFLSAQTLKPVSYADGEQELNGLVTDNAGSNKPGVLIIPAWMGINDEAKDAAIELAKLGYTVFIADIYGKGNIPSSVPEAQKISNYYTTNYKAYQHRVALALEELKKMGVNNNKLAVIGYCFGGTGALEAARSELPVQGVVSIHGRLYKSADRPTVPLNTKILVLHAANDEVVPDKDVQNLINEFREIKVDWQLIYYANSKHTFTNPKSPSYNEIMAKRAWAHTVLFLNEILK